jgi:hypothetical protein
LVEATHSHFAEQPKGGSIPWQTHLTLALYANVGSSVYHCYANASSYGYENVNEKNLRGGGRSLLHAMVYNGAETWRRFGYQ